MYRKSSSDPLGGNGKFETEIRKVVHIVDKKVVHILDKKVVHIVDNWPAHPLIGDLFKLLIRCSCLQTEHPTNKDVASGVIGIALVY